VCPSDSASIFANLSFACVYAQGGGERGQFVVLANVACVVFANVACVVFANALCVVFANVACVC